jgi:hypothetical protein
MGNSVSIFSQSESIAIPQTMIPCRRGGVVWAGTEPMTLPLETRGWSAESAWVWTVRATATVAINANTHAAAERNFILRDIISGPRIPSLWRGDSKIFALHKIAPTHINLSK